MTEKEPKDTFKICAAKVTLEQENDSCDMQRDGQFMEIESQDAGGGVYFYLSTKRWAFESIDELVQHLNKAMTILKEVK